MDSTRRLPTICFNHKAACYYASLLLCLIAFALRVYRLDAIGLDGDEAFSIHTAYAGVARILEMTASAEPHPPLYYVALTIWHPLAGLTEFALRYPSVIVSVLTTAYVAKIGALFFDQRVGLLAAAIWATNPYQVWFAQEARMYAPVAFGGIAALYHLTLLLKRQRKHDAALYVFFGTLSLYLHYYAIFVFALTTLLIAYAWRHREALTGSRAALMCQAIVLLLFLPWLSYASKIALYYAPFPRGSLDLLALMKDALIRYSLGNSSPAGPAFTISAAFAVIAVLGMLSMRRLAPRPFAWLYQLALLGLAGGPLAFGIAISILRPMFAARYLMVSAPAFYLLLAAGISILYRRSAVAGVIAATFTLMTQSYALYNHYSDPNYAKTDFRESYKYISDHVRQRDAVILDGWSQTFQFWYYNAIRGTRPLPSYLFPSREREWQSSVPTEIDKIMAKHSGVWLLDYDVAAYDPEHIVESYLAQRYFQALVHKVTTNRVVYYVSAEQLTASASQNFVCDDRLALRRVEVAATEARPGDFVPIALTWEALARVTQDYAISWRLVDPSGRLVLQRDSTPASGFLSFAGLTAGDRLVDKFAFPVPADALPGSYTLGIILYDRTSGATCDLAKNDVPRTGGATSLITLEVLDTPPDPAAARSDPTNRREVDIGPLSFLGYDMPRKPFKPGQTISLKLFWRTFSDLDQDYELHVRFAGMGGEAYPAGVHPIGPPWFPTSRWPKGRQFATYLDIKVPAGAPAGDYDIELWMKADQEREMIIERIPAVRVIGRPRNTAIPNMQFVKTANFGGLVELLGFDYSPSIVSGAVSQNQVRLRVYWRALREMVTSYKVFVHLVGEDGKIYGQHDKVPKDGEAPTDSWIPGEVISDNYLVSIQGFPPNGILKIITGFYDVVSGERIPVVDSFSDSVELTTVRLSGDR